jgi:K+-transporting ATPase ATPase C chain
MRIIIIALRLILVMMVLTGILYPLVVTGIAQVVFPNKANGSMRVVDEKIIGSELIGQKFVSERYFWSRPSAIDYNPIPSGATNFGPTSATLQDIIQQRRAEFCSANWISSKSNVPVDMIFASASGVDPHISPEAARLQIDRIAQARSLTREQKAKLTVLVEHCIEGPQLKIFGDPRVNVFRLNIALDEMK